MILIVLMNARPQGLLGTQPGRDRLMGEPLLELRGVSKSFGGLACIAGLDLHVDEHEIAQRDRPERRRQDDALQPDHRHLRPRRAARSTSTAQSLLGLEPHEIVGRGVARTFQTLRLFLNLTRQGERDGGRLLAHARRASSARSCARRGCAARSARSSALAEERLAFFGERLMGYRWDQPAYSLSYANRRRLEIARATATQAARCSCSTSPPPG